MNDFLYILILLGSLQGVIICFLLSSSRKNILSNRLLASVIGLITLPGFHLYFHYNGGFDSSSTVQVIHDLLPMVVIMPIGPLIFFYIRSLSEPGFTLTRKEYVHFIPAIIDFLPKIAALIFYLATATGFSFSSRAELANLTDIYSRYADIPRWLSMTIYIIAAVKYLQSRKAISVGNNIPTPVVTRWLQLFVRLFVIFQVIWFIYLIPYILPATSGWLLNNVNWFPVYLPMAILIYWLGIKGYLVMRMDNIQQKKITPASSALSEEMFKEAYVRLTKSIEQDKLYLNPELNLDKVSKLTGLAPKIISAVLNQYMETSFANFVNHYRIEEFKHRIGKEERQFLTIAGLAKECGFNSPATFQRTFKQFTGLSPTAFLKKLESADE